MLKRHPRWTTAPIGRANPMAISKPKSATTKKVISAFPVRQAEPVPMRLFIRDLVLSARIGVHQHERVANQRIRLNLELEVEAEGPIGDDLENTVCYGDFMTAILHAVANGHSNLSQTLSPRT